MLIKKITLIILLSLIILACGDSKSSKVDPEDYKSELRTHAKEFMTELKTVLQKNMKEGGPLQGCFCLLGYRSTINSKIC